MFLPAAPAESQLLCHVPGLLQGCKLMQMQTGSMHPRQCSVGKNACTDVEQGLSDWQTESHVRKLQVFTLAGNQLQEPSQKGDGDKLQLVLGSPATAAD